MTSHLIGFMRLKRRQGTAESFNVVSQLFLLPIRDGVLSFRASYGCVVYLSHKRPRPFICAIVGEWIVFTLCPLSVDRGAMFGVFVGIVLHSILLQRGIYVSRFL